MQQFNRCLISSDGNSKGTRQARQHVWQVEIILQESSQGSFHIENLFDRKNIRDNWLPYFEHARKLGTVKSYIHSVRFFDKFVLCDDLKECAPFVSKCNSLIVALESWLSIYQKKIKEACWKKDLIQLT